MSSVKNGDKPLLLVFPMDMAGHYLRCLELCKRLKDTIQIKFASSTKYGKYIAASGFETFNVKNFNAEKVTDAASRFDFSWITRTILENILDSQIEAIEKNKPDLVLGDTSFPLKMAAEKTGITFVSLVNGYMTKYYKLVRRAPHNHPAYKYSEKIPEAIFERLTRKIEHRAFRKIHEPFRKIRKDRELSPQHYFPDELEGDFNLICDLPEFFPQKALPATYEFIGPLYFTDLEREEEILNFLGDHHPNILVNMGSTGSRIKESFFNHPVFEKYKIVVSEDDNSSLSGSNIICKPFINNLAIMNQIDLVVCHGGNGSIYQALSHGIPVLCFPDNFEQEWNAQRVEELGLGVLVKNENPIEVAKLMDFWRARQKRPYFCSDKRKNNVFHGKVHKPKLL